MGAAAEARRLLGQQKWTLGQRGAEIAVWLLRAVLALSRSEQLPKRTNSNKSCFPSMRPEAAKTGEAQQIATPSALQACAQKQRREREHYKVRNKLLSKLAPRSSKESGSTTNSDENCFSSVHQEAAKKAEALQIATQVASKLAPRSRKESGSKTSHNQIYFSRLRPEEAKEAEAPQIATP